MLLPPRNIVQLYLKQKYLFTEPTFMELTNAPEIFVKNSYIGFNENLANASVTDTTSRTDGQTWPPHQVLSFVS